MLESGLLYGQTEYIFRLTLFSIRINIPKMAKRFFEKYFQ